MWKPGPRGKSGATKRARSGPTSTEAALSTVSVRHFSATQQPEKRESAKPARPRSRYSCTLDGFRIGMPQWISACSDWCAIDDDFAPGSSPHSASTPPFGAVPA